jgi:hypothetical protein
VDDIESDLSRFHRLDLWSVSFARAMRLAGRLPAYDGAVRQAMIVRKSEAPLSTTYAQAVDSPVQHAEQDTPPEVVEQLRRDALVRQYQAAGIDVTGIREVSSDEMERLIRE